MKEIAVFVAIIVAQTEIAHADLWRSNPDALCGPPGPPLELEVDGIGDLFFQLENLARDGDLLAQYALADGYLARLDNSDGDAFEHYPFDELSGMRWMHSAAEGDCAEAQLLLGHFLWHGWVSPPDLTNARWWLNRAYASGHPAAEETLRSFEFERWLNPRTDTAELSVEQLNWFSDRAESGDAWAAWAMGQYAQQGEQLEWMMTAAALGLAEANTAVGDILASERRSLAFGLEAVDPDQARRYWRAGAMQGHMVGLERWFRSLCGFDTEGCFSQSAEAREIFQVLIDCVEADPQNGRCVSLLVESYMYGVGTAVDENTARHWHEIGEQIQRDSGFREFRREDISSGN